MDAWAGQGLGRVQGAGKASPKLGLAPGQAGQAAFARVPASRPSSPWASRLKTSAGRLHREHATKTDVRIIDFVDTDHPALLRMWDKRQRGYRAMGYRLGSDDSSDF